MEPVFRILEIVASTVVRAAGITITFEGLGGSAPSLAEAKRLDEAELAERSRRAREHH